MEYTIKEIDEFLKIIANSLDISDDLFQAAEREYRSLADWIQKQTDYDISIYTQGSFSLGTVIKPINDSDDYDLDLVCEFANDYNITAKELKRGIVLGWLEKYREVKKIEEKRKCWHVEYKHTPAFHMDVIPGYRIREGDTIINITQLDESTDNIKYVGSNPAGYTEWFKKQCEVRYQAILESYQLAHGLEIAAVNEAVEIEDIPHSALKTPLQQAIQLLKRHRDIMFSEYPEEEQNDRISKADKPISILITTLVAQLYENEDSIFKTIYDFLAKVEDYLEEHKIDGEYRITDPSYPSDCFTDKWKDNPLRKEAFFAWLHQAQLDFDEKIWKECTYMQIGKRIQTMFGEGLGQRVLTEMANAKAQDIISGKLKMEPDTGYFSESGTVGVIPNHHHHNA